MSDKKTIIELKHLGKEFQGAKSNVRALRDINLEIQEGEIFGIIGLSKSISGSVVRRTETKSSNCKSARCKSKSASL